MTANIKTTVVKTGLILPAVMCGVNGFGAEVPLPFSKGGYLAGGADNRCVIAFDADGKEEWRIKAEDIPGFTLMFVAQVEEFVDGRLLVANWGGHHDAKKINSPCLGLISADRKQLVWSAQLTPRNAVASFHVIQQSEKASDGQ